MGGTVTCILYTHTLAHMYHHVVTPPVINNAVAQTVSGNVQVTISLGTFDESLGTLGDYNIVVIQGSRIADTTALGSNTLHPSGQSLNK